MRLNKRRILTMAGAAAILLLIVFSIVFMGKDKNDKVTVGFIMTGSIGEAGWNGMHYTGIKDACDKLDAKLIVKENVAEFTGECLLAIKELASEGAGMIVLSSYGYSEEAKDLVGEYPDIVFYVNSSEYHGNNMTSYFARMYQARYLAGIVAGMKTESNKIGYVAAMANNEVNRGINAFTLGVKRANPDASVVVMWTGAWNNKENEKEAAQMLIKEAGADVLTYHQNQANVIDVAEEHGIYSIGYHEHLEGCSDKYLTSVVCNWELVYEKLVREYIIGKGNININYWIGMEAAAVGLSAYSDEVSQTIRSEVYNAKQEFLSGRDVFSGVIYDIDGNLKCDDKEAISDEILLEQLDWYVKGVEFYER